MAYVPDAGDIVWVDFDPQAGREQAKHRPAIVLSPASYNGRAGLMLCCPTTTKIKSYPFEVKLAGRPPSVALADQVKGRERAEVNNYTPRHRQSAIRNPATG